MAKFETHTTAADRVVIIDIPRTNNAELPRLMALREPSDGRNHPVVLLGPVHVMLPLAGEGGLDVQ